jgi:hypothetical protein
MPIPPAFGNAACSSQKAFALAASRLPTPMILLIPGITFLVILAVDMIPNAHGSVIV